MTIRSRWWTVAMWVIVPARLIFSAEEPTKTSDYDAKIGPADREHWSFEKLVRPDLPQVVDQDWVRNPIDRFILSKLEAKGWTPNPAAEPAHLLRRVYVDLIGLPPTPEELRKFLADPSPEHLDQVVRDLLSRPQYGERWGRHWLDLVRYAETNGYERDGTKPHAWRYRDYVIRAFNEDKPYDRFVLEQLAGDELPDASIETIIATTFYRLGPWDDEPADPMTDRYDQLDDIVSTTSQVFLGLTLGCARCHDHKFEPLTQLDYYRMVANVNGLERPAPGRTDLDLPLGTSEQLERQSQRDAQIAELEQSIAKIKDQERVAFLKSGRSQLPEDAVAALLTPLDQRTPEQKQLADKNGGAAIEEAAKNLSDEAKQSIEEQTSKIYRLREETPDLPRGYILREVLNPMQIKVLKRGSPLNLGIDVEPGIPAVLCKDQPSFPESSASSSRRRLGMAQWIASKDNPLTARVIVNRVWQFHFGEGIVRSPNDFGVMGFSPSHPELLDWLADWFVHEANWSIKKLHLLFCESQTYRMSKRSREDYLKLDPTGELMWRVTPKRLEVEAICDQILFVSGKLNLEMNGPSVYPFVPRQALEGHSDPDKIWPAFDEKLANRRTVYTFVKRSLVVPMLEVLDFCDTTRSAAQRNVTNVAPQALAMLNGDFVNRQAQHFADRLIHEAGDSLDEQLDLAYELAFCRKPSEKERARLTQFYQAELEEARKSQEGESEQPEVRRKALRAVCRAVFNLNEFVYTD